MVDYISQAPLELKHISFLRKIISQKFTGRLHLHFSSDEVIQIEFCLGDMIGGDHIIDALRKGLSSPVVKFAWEDCVIEAKFGWLAPTIGVSSALTKLPIDSQRLKAYRMALTGLPDVTLKTMPIHRYNFGDEVEYQYLYQMSLRAPTFKTSTFFSNIISEEILLRRIRAMLLAFLLGYLVPVPKAAPIKATSKAGIATRILNRFRGVK